MPRASHRLDLLVVPVDPWSRPVREAEGWFRAQVEAGRVGADGARGARAEELVVGGFERLIVVPSEGVVLHGNRLGGFEVTCPRCGGTLASAFSAAWAGRAGDAVPSLSCHACAWSGPLTGAVTRPEVALGSLAVIFADAGAASVRAGVLADLEGAIGPARVVWSRPSL